MSDSDFAAEFRQSDSEAPAAGATDSSPSRPPRKRAPRKPRPGAPRKAIPPRPRQRRRSRLPLLLRFLPPRFRAGRTGDSPDRRHALRGSCRGDPAGSRFAGSRPRRQSGRSEGGEFQPNNGPSGGRKRHRKRKRRGNRESYKREGARIHHDSAPGTGEGDDGFSDDDGDEANAMTEGESAPEGGEGGAPVSSRPQATILERKEQRARPRTGRP